MYAVRRPASRQHLAGRPLLMQVNYKNDHFTEEKKVVFRNFANMYAFALWQAGYPDFQPNSVTVK